MLVWGSAEDGATVLVNGEEALRNGPSFNWSVSLDEGPRTVRVLVRDRAGNEAEVVIGVTVDLTPPELVIDEPEEEETMTPLTSITLSGVVLDAFPVRVFANGVEATVSEGQWTVVVDLSPGYQVIDVKAEDEAGHQTFGSRTVFSDPVPPTMTLVLVLGDEVHTDTSGTFRTREVKATLRVSLDETARILVADRGTWEGSKGMNIIELDLAADAVNRLRVDAMDPAGNLAGEVELVVVVDITPPPLSISTPVVTGEGRNRVVEFAGTTEPGANLTVNGKGFPVGTDGAFAIIVSVVEGDNPFEFVATDQVGNVANETVVVTYGRPDEPVSDPVSWGAYVLVATVDAAVVVVALLYTRRRP